MNPSSAFPLKPRSPRGARAQEGSRRRQRLQSVCVANDWASVPLALRSSPLAAGHVCTPAPRPRSEAHPACVLAPSDTHWLHDEPAVSNSLSLSLFTCKMGQQSQPRGAARERGPTRPNRTWCDDGRFYACSAQRGHRSPHVATEPLKGDWCDWETQSLTLFRFDLKVNSRVGLVVIDPARAALRTG